MRDADTFAAAVDGIHQWIALDVAALAARVSDALEVVGALTIGPTFTGPPLAGGADADFISDGVLWDVKSSKKVELRDRDVHQLLGYTLFDFDDQFGITQVGICSSRFGVTGRWDAEWLLGRDIADARTELREILTSSAGRPPQPSPIGSQSVDSGRMSQASCTRTGPWLQDLMAPSIVWLRRPPLSDWAACLLEQKPLTRSAVMWSTWS